MPPPTRVKGHRVGQLAALRALDLLVEAGCATNELTGSDYGFDVHVLLPEEYPTRDSSRWVMGARTALVQIKGGGSFNNGVKLPRERWQFYLRSPVPVYLAVVPSRGEPWIELVDRLASGLELLSWSDVPADRMKPERLEPDEGSYFWNPQVFVEDAILQARLGGRARRRIALDWARRHASDADPDRAFMFALAELAAAETNRYEQLEDEVRRSLDAFPGLLALIAGGDVEGPPLDHQIAEHLSGIEYIEPGGVLSTEARELRALLTDPDDPVGTAELARLVHRECFGCDDHLSDRGLG